MMASGYTYPHHQLTRSQIDETIARTAAIAPHWTGVWRLIRDEGLRLVQIMQGEKASFWPLPRDKRRGPLLLVHLGDDLAASLGPPAFHKPSLKRFFRDCGPIAINAAEARPEPYAAAAFAAMLLPRPVVLLECTPDSQDAWIRFAKKCGKTDGDFLLFAVKGHPPTGVKGVCLGDMPPLRKETLH